MVSRSPHRVSTPEDAANQLCDRLVHLGLTVSSGIIVMRRSRILQDTHDLVFGQNLVIVHSQQQRFADSKGSLSGDIGNMGHSQTFHRPLGRPGKMPGHVRTTRNMAGLC